MADLNEIFPPNMINPAPQGSPFSPVEMPPVGAAQQMAPLVNPAPPGLPEKRPPASPQEFEERKAGWTNIIEQIKSNPKLLQAMITTGTAMMGGQRPGETAGGTVGRGIQGGMMHYQMLQDNETRNQQKQQELDQRGAESESRIAKTSQDMDFDKQEQPLKMTKLQSDADLSRRKSRIADLELKFAEAEEADDPDGQKRIKARLNKEKAELKRIEAAAASSYASAGEHNERTRGLKADNDAEAVLADPKSTPEQIQRATRQLETSKPETSHMSAQVQNRKDLVKHYSRMLNKPEDSPEVSQMVVLHDRRESLEKEYAGEMKAAREASTDGKVDETVLWKQFRDRKLRFGVDVEGIFNALKPKAAPATNSTTPTKTDTAAWDKARKSVPVGQQYVGPDDITYTRKD